MRSSGLIPRDVVESILSATSIAKTLRSTRHRRAFRRERFYVIKSKNFTGTQIYTKGKIDRSSGQDRFYILISSKIDEDEW
jgi:hypothetical protein